MYMRKQYLPYSYHVIDGDSCRIPPRTQPSWCLTNHYAAWYTTSLDTNETVDKLGMVKIS